MIKLRKMDIEGLRGARLPVALDFTATCKSVIVYGPNGSGKSTFSDAIEWFLSKRVNHLWREDCFEEALRNLNLTDTESAVVRLKFSDSKQRRLRLFGQNVLFLKWRLAVIYLCGGVPYR